MDFKTRDIGLVEYSLTWQHTAFQPRNSACRKVIHSERCDYLRRMLHHMEYETNFSALPEACLDSIGRVEGSLESPYIFHVCGYSIPIQDDRLASALLEFGDMERGILLLSYSMKLSDQAVGELLKLSRSRVWRLKPRLLSELREKMKE